QLIARHPRASFAIVGEGPDLAALRARAASLGVAGAVHFAGPRAGALAALSGMQIFAHPSWAEAFPYVILEAMSLARPIVASDVGGIGEAIVDGDSGLLTPPRDAGTLAQALIELLDDRETTTRVGERALLRLAQFTREAMVARLAATYSEIARSATSMRLLQSPERRSLPGRD